MGFLSGRCSSLGVSCASRVLKTGREVCFDEVEKLRYGGQGVRRGGGAGRDSNEGRNEGSKAWVYKRGIRPTSST